MNQISSFLLVAQAFCAASGVAEATLSSKLLNDGKRIGQIKAGADIGARRLERAMQWLSNNWPSEAEWPEGVERLPVRIAEAAE